LLARTVRRDLVGSVEQLRVDAIALDLPTEGIPARADRTCIGFFVVGVDLSDRGGVGTYRSTSHRQTHYTALVSGWGEDRNAMATDGRDSTWYERRAKAIRILASEAFCGYTRERLEQIASSWESCATSMRLAERNELWLVSRQVRGN